MQVNRGHASVACQGEGGCKVTARQPACWMVAPAVEGFYRKAWERETRAKRAAFPLDERGRKGRARGKPVKLRYDARAERGEVGAAEAARAHDGGIAG